jgi:hypothetical protein
MRRTLPVVWQHRLGKKATCSGGIYVHEDRIAVQYAEGGQSNFRGLTADGQVVWEHTWSDLGSFLRGSGNDLFTGGERIRRISMRDGTVLAEKAVDGTFDPYHVFDAGPVYNDLERIQGRDQNLELLWDLPDGEFFAPHHNRLCQITEAELITLRPPDLTPARVTLERPVPRPMEDYHTHCGSLWCQFSLTTGGRTAFDETTGKVVWSFAEPDGYGLSVFDDASAYTTYGTVASYDLCTGAQRWHSDRPIVTRAHVERGKLYGGAAEGSSPVVYILDAQTGRLLLDGTFAYELSGMGHEPSPVRPLGEKLLVVGMRHAVVAVAIE